MRRALLFLAVVFLWAPCANATDYYFSADGQNGGPGSATQPWQTLDRLQTVRLSPGDRVLLRGGDTFWGSISLDPDEAGTPAAPIVITSYGAGRATIQSGDGTAIGAYNVAGYRISNLVLTGSGATNVGSGIHFFSDRTDAVLLPYLRIENVDASGYGGYGLLIGASVAGTGYRDVRITGVVAHHNARGGIFTYAAAPNTHSNVYVGYSVAHSNPGVAGALVPTGNGILISGVNGGTIERSVAWGNGTLNNYSSGPIGIWTYDSRAMVIQYNEAHHNRTGGTKDGGGFCLDQNMSDSVLQYNYSHDNDGAGYLLANRYDTHTHTNNTIRYNISQNDSRKVGYGAIHLWGGIRNTEIYNNTVFLSPASAGTPYAVLIKSSSYTGNDLYSVHFHNNIFQTAGGARVLSVSSSQLDGAVDFDMERNAYFTTGGAFTAVWAGVTYTSFDAWRSASGKEMSRLLLDPQLTAPGSGGTYDDASLLSALDAYRLKPGSPLIDAGLDLAPAVNPGTRDFYGTALPQGGGYDIGADEGGGVCGGVAVAPASQTFASAAGTGTYQVTAPATCNWTAASNVAWVTANPLTGAGNGSGTYTVSANTTTVKRTARITVGGSTLTITQAPALAMLAPNGGEKVYTSSPYTIEWVAGEASRFDVAVSVDGGLTYQPVPGCTALGGSARSCVWNSPGPAATSARMRVTAQMTGGATLSDVSDQAFAIVSGVPSITVTTPNTSTTNWGVGSTQSIKWSHNLGSGSYVDVDLSRDGGISWQALAVHLKNSASTSGALTWKVTSPTTTAARVRVRWSSGSAADVSDANFTIAAPYITVTSPSSTSTSWGYETTRSQTWSTNLGAGDIARVKLSIDGGATFPITLGEVSASTKTLKFVTPALAAPTASARVKVEWASDATVLGVNPAAFRIEPAYVTVTRPDLSTHTWTVGTSGSITWMNNLGTSESVSIELSTDGGTTYPYVLASSTASDGSHTVTVQSAWVTSSARVRITWLKKPAVTDESNQTFAIR